METEKLIEKALTNLMGEYTDNGRAQALALIAIAQELKRMNDLREDDRNYEAWKTEHGL